MPTCTNCDVMYSNTTCCILSWQDKGEETRPIADNMSMLELKNVTPHVDQVPMVVVDDDMPQVKDVSPLTDDDVLISTEAFPPVPDSLSILIE